MSNGWSRTTWPINFFCNWVRVPRWITPYWDGLGSGMGLRVGCKAHPTTRQSLGFALLDWFGFWVTSLNKPSFELDRFFLFFLTLSLLQLIKFEIWNNFNHLVYCYKFDFEMIVTVVNLKFKSRKLNVETWNLKVESSSLKVQISNFILTQSFLYLSIIST